MLGVIAAFDPVATFLLGLSAADVLRAVLKKSPPYLLAPYWRLYKESKFLRAIIHDPTFAGWSADAGRYVGLLAIKAKASAHAAQESVLGLLRAYVARGEPLVLLGDPGAGKTTAAQALMHELASQAYRRSLVLILSILAVAALVMFATSNVTAMAAVFLVPVVFEPFLRRGIVPVFIEARSDYAGGAVPDWCRQLLKEKLGEEPFYGRRAPVQYIVDGVNEVQASLHGTFEEGWRGVLKQPRRPRVIFTSRRGEEATLRLAADVFEVVDLDDAGVKKFLQVYGQETAAQRHSTYAAGQEERDFAILEKNDLLGPGGIGRNPYWLKMIVDSDFATANRSVVYQFATRLIRREIEEKPEYARRKSGWKAVPLEEELDALAALALCMQDKGRIGFSDRDGWDLAASAIRDALGENSPYTEHDVIGEAESATLLRTRPRELIEFRHQLVQEFFAAYGFRHKPQELAARAGNVRWFQPALMLGSLLASSKEGLSSHAAFVREIVGDGSDSGRLLVAIAMTASSRERSAELTKEVVEAFGRRLEGGASAEHRRMAMELSKIAAEQLIDGLADIARQASEKAAGAAIEILGELARRDKKALETLLSLFSDSTLPASVRDVAETQLVDVGEPAAERLIVARKTRAENLPIDRVLQRMGSAASPSLMKVLADDGDSSRKWAVYMLGEIRDPTTFDGLLSVLAASNADERASGSPAPARLPFARPPADFRKQVIEALPKFEPAQARGAIVELVAALDDSDRTVRAAAARAIGSIPGAEPDALQRALDDKDLVVRQEAIRALIRLGEEGTAAARRMMNEGKPSRRAEAIEAFSGTKDPLALAAVGNALKGDPSRHVRRTGWAVLRKAGKASLPVWLDLLNDDADENRVEAVQLISELRYPALFPFLVERCSDPSPWVRGRAILAMGAFEGEEYAPSVIQAAIKGLADADTVASAAQSVLIPRGKQALEPLKAAIPFIGKSEAAVRMLAKIGDDSVIPMLQDSLADGNPAVWQIAIDALASRGKYASRALLRVLESDNPQQRKAAAVALRRVINVERLQALQKVAGDEIAAVKLMLGDDSPETLRKLAELARHDRAEVRRTAISSIAIIGAEGAEMLAALLRDDTSALARDAAAGFLQLAAHEPQVLLPFLRDAHPNVRAAAAVALGEAAEARGLDTLKSLAATDHAPTVFGAPVSASALNAIAGIERAVASKG